MPNENNLPDGTDTIIDGAMRTETTIDPTTGQTTGTSTTNTTTMVVEDELIVAEPTTRERAVQKLRDTGDEISREAAGKARGYVGQGLERASEGITNISRLVGDTAEGIDERLGVEYGDYARRTASYLDDTAQRLASKDPDQLIGDTRDFVRRSPGVALAGAAIVGFALARLVQSGFDAERRD